MNQDQDLFQFTSDGCKLLLDLALPSGKRNVLVLGPVSADAFCNVKGGEVMVETAPSGVPGSFDGAIVIPHFENDAENPVLPAQGEWSLPSLSSMQAYLIAHAWSEVRPGGRVVALVGKNLLALDRGGWGKARQALRDHGLSLIAELSNSALRGSQTSSQTYVAVLERNEKAGALQTMKFVDASEEESLPPVGAFKAWHEGTIYPGVKAEPAIISQDEIENEGRLDPDFYDPAFHAVRPPPDCGDELLGDIADIATGVQLGAQQRLMTRPTEGGIRYIQVRHVQSEGTIDATTYWVDASTASKYALKKAVPGDILVSATGTIGRIVLVGPEHSDGLLSDAGLRRVRLKDTKKHNPQVIAKFLRERLGQLQLERHATGAVVANLSNPNLAKVRVFLPRPEKKEVSDYERTLESAAATINNLLHGANANDPRVRANIAKALQEWAKLISPPSIAEKEVSDYERTLESAAATINNLLHGANANDPRVRAKIATGLREWATAISPPSIAEIAANEFPTPLAVAFRRYEAAANDPYQQLGRMTHLVEACVFFVFYVFVADAKRMKTLSDPIRKALEDALKNDTAHLRETFIGEYIKSAEQSLSLVPKLLNPKIVEQAKYLRNNLRNVVAHSAPGAEQHVKKMIRENEPRLFKLLEALRILVDQNYTLCRITKQFYHTSKPHYHCELYKGHALVNRLNIEERESDSIIRADHEHLVLLCADSDEPLDLWPYYRLHYDGNTFGEAQLFFVKSCKNKVLIAESIRSAINQKFEDGVDDFFLKPQQT